MSDTAPRNVRVELRHVVLAEAAALTDEGGGRVFLALDEPPPVRSVLAVSDGDSSKDERSSKDAGSSRAIEVVRVVEVPESGGSSGVHGRVVDADALARFAAVGTERLPGGTKESSPSQASPEPERSDEDGNGAQLAMPAPVVVVEADSEPISVGEGDEGESEGDGEVETSGEHASESGEGPPKKRKGRKRR